MNDAGSQLSFDVRWVRPLNSIRQNDCVRAHLQLTEFGPNGHIQWQARGLRSANTRRGVRHSVQCTSEDGPISYALRTTRTCDRSAVATRVEPPSADCASRSRFGVVSHGPHRRARHCARWSRAPHERVGRSLLSPLYRPETAVECFTRNRPRFAPAARI